MTDSPTPSHYLPGDTFENTVIKEIGLIRQNLNPDDVFALDAGLTIYQINGPNCDKDEKVGQWSDIRALILFFGAKTAVPMAFSWHTCGTLVGDCSNSVTRVPWGNRKVIFERFFEAEQGHKKW